MSGTRQYLWDPWRTAAVEPKRLAVAADEETCTFAELVDRSDRLAAGVRALGLNDGSVISTDIPTGPRFFALALAAIRYGYGLVPLSRDDVSRSELGVSPLSDIQAGVHITDRPSEQMAPAGGRHVLTDDAVVAAGRGSRPPGSGVRAGYLSFATRGRTGSPHVVVRSRPRRSYKGVAVADNYGAGLSRGPFVMADPTYHMGTLGPALYALQAGSAVVVQREWSAQRFAELVDGHTADSAMLSPDRLLDAVVAGAVPWHRLRVLFHTGEPCPPALKRAAIGLFGPVLHEYYGTSKGPMTEIGTAAWLERPGSVGRPLPGIRIDIRKGDRPLGVGQTGEVCVLMRAADRDDADVLRTGDAGYLDADGFLYLVGRAGSPAEPARTRLEHEIRLLPDVGGVVVIGIPPEACFVDAAGPAGAASVSASPAVGT